MRFKRYWLALAVVVTASFLVLFSQKSAVEHAMPPIPSRVVDERGQVLFRGEDVTRGQNVWQSLGGQQIGSIWGHGAYVAPDWTADYLHREAEFILASWASASAAESFAALPAETQASLRERLRSFLRTNRYAPETGTLKLEPERVAALEASVAHYTSIFRDGKEAYAIPPGALRDPDRARAMVQFFWWTSWAASTDRPGDTATYTSNWPHEPLVGNVPTTGALGWSFVSFVMLVAGIGALVWHHARGEGPGSPDEIPLTDPLGAYRPTPSQRATYKYFAVVGVLIVAQVGLGGITAHYGVEGFAFYGIELAKWLPYAVTRTWHTQLGILWIATAWLATGLFLAPLIGREPPGQRLGVNVLFAALVVVVLGTLGGTWAAIQQRLQGDAWYWFGHQGYEYVDLGRVWQILLFIGLFIWLFLMVRALAPALARRDERRPLLVLFVLSSVAIALFYGAGLMYGRTTHLAQVEYWRWWLVHLWVEGFFEVFATAAISYLFVHLGLVQPQRAIPAVLFATTVFLAGGIIGTLHHTYFAGTPSSVLALGATFSALEVVPLSMIGFDVWQNLRLLRSRPWVARYKWPIYFFIAVGFWNLVGAGMFGFLINPPIALYYMQGLNLTPVHSHTALFGVYGMLGIGLTLFCLRVLRADIACAWKERQIAFSFWTLNVGLAAMVLFSVLPIGVLQTVASIERGTWWARSAEFSQTPLIQTLRWLRAPGDTLFAVGAVVVAWFILGAWTGWSYRKSDVVEEAGPRRDDLAAASRVAGPS